MASLNFCAEGGYLVGAQETMGADSGEFYADTLPTEVGCSHLVCQSCGARVRSAVGIIPLEREGVSPARIHDSEDWLVSELFAREQPPAVGRFYCCRCTWWIETQAQATDPSDPDPTDRLFPWRCGGHPMVTLPFVLDGVTIDPDTDYTALCRRVFAQGAPPDARASERSVTGWIQKLFVRLTGNAAAEKLGNAVGELLSDPDPRVRGCALTFFSIYPDAPGAGRVARVGRDQPGLYEGIRDPTHPRWSLAERLSDTLGRRILVRREDGQPSDEPALDLARKAALSPAGDTLLLHGLVSVDRKWVLDHAVTIAMTDSEGWRRLLEAFKYRDPERLKVVAETLVETACVDREALRQFADDELCGFMQASVLSALDSES